MQFCYIYIGVKSQHLGYSKLYTGPPVADSERRLWVCCGTQTWQLHTHSLDTLKSFKGHYIETAESPSRWPWPRKENVCSHSNSQSDALLAGSDLPKGLSIPPPKPLSFLDDSPWTMRLGMNNRSRDGNASVYAVMGMPSHACTHESGERPCLWLCWKMMPFL